MSDIATLVEVISAAGIERAWTANAVPKSPSSHDYPYVVLSSARIAPEVRTLDGSGNNERRFVVQVFSRTAEGIEATSETLFYALDAAYLPLDGEPQCWLEVSSSVARDADDRGVLNLTQTYRY